MKIPLHLQIVGFKNLSPTSTSPQYLRQKHRAAVIVIGRAPALPLTFINRHGCKGSPAGGVAVIGTCGFNESQSRNVPACRYHIYFSSFFLSVTEQYYKIMKIRLNFERLELFSKLGNS
jgi:hypothetical protein